MRKFQITLYILAVIPILTGLLDLALGLRAIESFSEGLSSAIFDDELYNAQYRFLGGVWLGIGLLMYVAARDLERYATVLRVVLWSIFVGGIGRLISVVQFGIPENTAGAAFVIGNMLIETVGMLVLLWWHARLLATRRQSE